MSPLLAYSLIGAGGAVTTRWCHLSRLIGAAQTHDIGHQERKDEARGEQEIGQVDEQAGEQQAHRDEDGEIGQDRPRAGQSPGVGLTTINLLRRYDHGSQYCSKRNKKSSNHHRLIRSR